MDPDQLTFDDIEGIHDYVYEEGENEQ
ncbi:hypothetical protein SEA_KIPPER29_59 [Mycobacterium phage Kipper29]|uniref:Uncharacterized protein n=5 Tax=Caudoviricetes TaxID=2731619 RepID=A0A2U8UQ16_9CAUD|nr:hypothetical protein AXJ19_gp053 [Mycobacterium phage VohminGhazi]YP_010061193.1 hypothetical protein KIP54_gp43 [Mycobacterium phage JewelBug]YP_010061285.1 hypothetical protein KIP55_gp049 [Mycobacterium phage Priamo]AEK08501.1 hypothetical protein PBI_DAVINCI_58 [Mycobacterium phage DaVinci]AMQ66893.1 hypothetical protein PBI_MCFLY_59 [Mycobacterium phage McFly]AMW64408.1 hypothetical protein PBI_KAZAN_60 [Mycobacterium phage Kazan]AOT24796.1 hypothetical protein PBI_ISIPHIWO_57 [Mycoba